MVAYNSAFCFALKNTAGGHPEMHPCKEGTCSKSKVVVGITAPQTMAKMSVEVVIVASAMFHTKCSFASFEEHSFPSESSELKVGNVVAESSKRLTVCVLSPEFGYQQETLITENKWQLTHHSEVPLASKVLE